MIISSVSDLKLVARSATNRVVFYDSNDRPIVGIKITDQVQVSYTDSQLIIVNNESEVYRFTIYALYDIDGKGFTPIDNNSYTIEDYQQKLQEAFEWLQTVVLVSCCDGGASPLELRFYANFAAFPTPGTAGLLYIDETTNDIYRWDSPDYIRLGGSAMPETTGIIYGGELSAVVGGTTFDITEGTAQIVTPSASMDGYSADIQILSWVTQTGIAVTNISTDPFTYVLIDSSGSVVQQSTPFTDSQYKTHIIIGVICHIDLATINLVTNSQNVTYESGHRLVELIESFGVIKKSGLFISANGVNLQVDRSAGTVFKIGSNYTTDQFEPDVSTLSSVTPASLCRVYRDGSGGYVFDTNGGLYYNNIDPDNYDDGTGTPSPVGGSKWTVQRLYTFPNNPNDIICYYGIERYNNFSEARANLEFENFTEADITVQNAVFLGFLFVSNGTTDLSDAGDARFLQSGSFRGIPPGGGGSGGGGGGGVSSVTGYSVDNTDPANPIVNAIPTAGTNALEPVTGDVEYFLSNSRKALKMTDGLREYLVWFLGISNQMRVGNFLASNPTFGSYAAFLDDYIHLISGDSVNGQVAMRLYQLQKTIEVSTTTSNFKGITYGADYSADMVLRSLIDQEVLKKRFWTKAGTPTTSDDSTQGFAVGSLIYDTTNDIIYRCTDNSASAATWVLFYNPDVIENNQTIALSGANVTTTSATAVDITGLVTPTLPANSSWYFEIYLATTCTGTGGIKFGFTTPSGGSGFLYVEGIGTGVTGFQSGVSTGTLIATGVTRVNGNAQARLFGRISIGSTAGAVQIQFASGTAGQTSTIGAGNGASIMRITKVA